MTKEQLTQATETQAKIESINTSLSSVKEILSKGAMPELYFKFINQKNSHDKLFLSIPDNLSYKILDMVTKQLNDDLEILNSQFEKL